MILGGIIAVVIVTTLYNHIAKGNVPVIEGLESGNNGTISDQLKAATKALDGGTELMSDVADLSKNKTEVIFKSGIAFYGRPLPDYRAKQK